LPWLRNSADWSRGCDQASLDGNTAHVAQIAAGGREAPTSGEFGKSERFSEAGLTGGKVAHGGGMRTIRPADYRVARAAFIGAWLLLSSPWMLGWVTIPYDAKALFQAQIQFLSNAIHSGQSPMWAPHVFVGLPQVADPQSMIFSPAYLLAYFDAVPSFRALDTYVFVLLGFAGLAVINLFQGRGWHPAAGVLAAVAIAFGSSAAWRIQHIGQVQSYAFFCMALWLLDRLLRSPAKGTAGLAGLAIGAMLAEANQVSLLGLYVLAGLVVGHWLSAADQRAEVRLTLPSLAIAGCTTTFIAGIPVLMTSLFLMSSNRPSIALAEAAHGSLHPVSLLTMVVGDLFGALDPSVDYWGPFSTHWNPRELTLSQNMSQLYLGALPMLLLLTIGLSRRLVWAEEVRVFSVCALLMLFYAVGTHTPLFGAMYWFVPGVSLFRRPADATFLLGAMIAIVAGYVAHRWLSTHLPQPQRGWKTARAILVGGFFVVAILVAVQEQKFELAQKPIALALAWMLASVVVFRHIRVAALNRPVLAVLVTTSLITMDLRFNNGPNESTAGSADDYEVLNPQCRNETIKFLKERMRRTAGSEWRDRVELVGLGFEWPNSALIHGVDHTLGYNPLRIDVVSKAIGARDHIAGPDQRWFTPLFPSYRSLIANLLGLRFVASSVPIEQVDKSLTRGDLRFVARTKHAYIYENDEVLPRVILATDAFPADFSEMIKSGRWPDFDPKSTALIDRSDEAFWSRRDVAVRDFPSVMSARITRYENTRVEVDVEAAQDGVLVLHDVWHPWWVASVDGQTVPIHKANVLFRAVSVPAGRHRVAFEFQPFSGAFAELRSKVFDGQ
jgi:hypothetical protein